MSISPVMFVEKDMDRMSKSNEMSLCVLASGSAGNCIWHGTDTTALLIDAGISTQNLRNKLNAIGESIERLSAICLTHEHTNHARGAIALCKQYNIPLYATQGTFNAIGHSCSDALAFHPVQVNHPFSVGDVLVKAFSVSHNAVDPVGFAVRSAEGSQIGILMDTGAVTDQMVHALTNCDALVLEANYDEELLNNASLPQELKERIRGSHGHLSNTQAADLLTRLKGSRLKQVFLAHLFEPCNSPELAVRSVRRALDETTRIKPRLWSVIAQIFLKRCMVRTETGLICIPPKRVGPVWSLNRSGVSWQHHL